MSRNRGTLRNASVWTSGKRGTSVGLDGSNDYVEIPSTAALTYTGTDITFSAWINPNLTESNGSHILSKPWNANGEYNYRITYNSDQTVTVILVGATSFSYTPTQTIPRRQWTLVTVTVTTAKLVTVYLNGVAIGSTSHAISSWVPPSGNALTPLCIGTLYPYGDGWGGNTGFSLDGRIDDVRIYNQALSATEVAALYRSGEVVRKTANNTGLVGYWPLDEATSTIAGDFSGNRNNGTLSNFALSGATSNWAVGKRGAGLDFDGSNDQVYGTIPAATFAGDFTITAWFNHRALTQWGAIFSNSVGTNETAIMTMRDSTTQMGIMRVGVIDSGVFVDLGADHYGKWIYGVIRRQGSNLTVYAYKDGQLLSSTGTLSWTLNTDNEFYIGRHYAGGTHIFNGKIDDVRVYNRGLSDAEINTLYRSDQTKINAPQDNKLTNGLVAYWTFNGKDVGSTFVDITGQGNSAYTVGVATSSILTTGKVGQAIALSGGAPYLTMINNSGPDNISTGKVSVSAWVYPNNASSFMTVFSNDRDCGGCGSYKGYSLYTVYAGSAGFRIWNSDGSGPYGASTGTVPPAKEWSFVTGTYDGATIKYYMNGTLLASTASVGNGTLGFPATFLGKIGQLGCCSSTYTMDGKIDELRIYNRALTLAEVKQLYLMGK